MSAADLQGFPASNEPATDGPRVRLLKLELARLQRVNLRLQDTLGRVFSEVRDYPDEKPYSCDSYLPPHMVAEVAEALRLAGVARAFAREPKGDQCKESFTEVFSELSSCEEEGEA